MDIFSDFFKLDRLLSQLRFSPRSELVILDDILAKRVSVPEKGLVLEAPVFGYSVCLVMLEVSSLVSDILTNSGAAAPSSFSVEVSLGISAGGILSGSSGRAGSGSGEPRISRPSPPISKPAKFSFRFKGGISVGCASVLPTSISGLIGAIALSSSCAVLSSNLIAPSSLPLLIDDAPSMNLEDDGVDVGAGRSNDVVFRALYAGATEDDLVLPFSLPVRIPRPTVYSPSTEADLSAHCLKDTLGDDGKTLNDELRECV